MSDPIQIPRSGAPRVSIVIPSAADPQLLFACLRALERHLPASIPTETIVVLDGAPEDAAAGSRRRLLARASSRRPSASDSRARGTAGAGWRAGSSSRSSTTTPRSSTAGSRRSLAAADAHPEAGAFGGLVLFPDGTPQTAGVVLYRDGTAVPPWTGAPPPPESFDRPRAVDFCASNALLVRAEAWDAVGGLDERFFPAYFVDADLAMGLREAGWSVLFEPRARSRHRRGGSSRKEFREWVSARNRAAFLAKWREALAAHEPWDEGSPETVVRALARAEALATRLGARADGRVPGPAPATADAALEEKRSLEQDLALHRAYAKSLEENLAAIQDLRWWRIYRRLLPVLEPLVAALRRLSRPGSSSRKG